MDRLFDERFGHILSERPWREDGMRTLALDVSETDDCVVVEASLPGFDPNDVDISISGNVLTIKGEKKQEEEKEEKGKYHYHERRYGAVQRMITLPVEVNVEAAEALFDKGELKLTLPKVEKAKAKRIEVKAK
jgi:HSP20 family protein